MLSACAGNNAGFLAQKHDLSSPEGINQYVNNVVAYEDAYRDAKPLANIIATKYGNCADIATYKQHLLSANLGLESNVVKGVTTDGLQHAVVMYQKNGQRWFLDNRQSRPTQAVFQGAFLNINTREVLWQ